MKLEPNEIESLRGLLTAKLAHLHMEVKEVEALLEKLMSGDGPPKGMPITDVKMGRLPKGRPRKNKEAKAAPVVEPKQKEKYKSTINKPVASIYRNVNPTNGGYQAVCVIRGINGSSTAQKFFSSKDPDAMIHAAEWIVEQKGLVSVEELLRD